MTETPSTPHFSESGVDAVLRDGSTMRVRPVHSTDLAPLTSFYDSLSDESRYFRFFSSARSSGQVMKRFVELDADSGFGLVALGSATPAIAGHATYIRTGPSRAEVAFAIADEMQRLGLGTILLGQLAGVASASGIEEFYATVLPENHRMISVFRHSGFDVQTRSEPGEITVTFPTSFSPDALARFRDRERTAVVAAVRHFLKPQSVAVIGASRDPASIGGRVFANIRGGFTGVAHPVNRAGGTIQGISAFKSIGDIPGPVDLAVVCVPAATVVEVARECAVKRVPAMVVVTAGFAEAGPQGVRRQTELLDVCRAAGIRLVGPNCIGVVNTDPAVHLNATFGPGFPPAGQVGVMTQSGAVGLAVIDHARSLGIGISSMVSVGNKADISGNDLLQYWEEDSATRVCLLYLESFGNPRKFARLSRRLAHNKPVIAVKSGRSPAGARAAASHTAAILSASDVTIDALLEQAGVIRTETIAELLDVARLLASQPVPAGNRVGIVTNAGGLAILCADAAVAGGLDVVTFSASLQDRLRGFLPPESSAANPVDMIASASPEQYQRVVEELCRSGEIDSLVAIHIPAQAGSAAAVMDAVEAGQRQVRLPVAGVMMSVDAPIGSSAELTIPWFSFPEDAGRVLAKAAKLGEWRLEATGAVPELSGIDRDRASALIARSLGRTPGWLDNATVLDLLGSYGIPIAESRLVNSAAAAARAARELGGPVALKGVAATLLHKTEMGAVVLGLTGGAAVAKAARAIAARMEQAGIGHPSGYHVQRMAPAGAEVLVGVVSDRSLGPVIACAAGGTLSELIKDVSVRITPLTDRDARRMVRSLKTFPLLDGYRGAPKLRVDALEEILLRVSSLVETHPDIVEMDLNPVIVHPGGALVVDARIRVALVAPAPPVGVK